MGFWLTTSTKTPKKCLVLTSKYHKNRACHAGGRGFESRHSRHHFSKHRILRQTAKSAVQFRFLRRQQDSLKCWQPNNGLCQKSRLRIIINTWRSIKNYFFGSDRVSPHQSIGNLVNLLQRCRSLVGCTSGYCKTGCWVIGTKWRTWQS